MHPQQIIRILGKEENPPPTHVVCHSSDYETLRAEKLPDHVRLSCSELVQPGVIFLLRERPVSYLAG